jgi:hypothetical protein
MYTASNKSRNNKLEAASAQEGAPVIVTPD